jgi:hypothetical protein
LESQGVALTCRREDNFSSNAPIVTPSNSTWCVDEEVAQVHDNDAAVVADRTFHNYYFLSTYSAVSFDSFGHDDSTSTICHFGYDLNAALRNADSLYDCVVFAFV